MSKSLELASEAGEMLRDDGVDGVWIELREDGGRRRGKRTIGMSAPLLFHLLKKSCERQSEPLHGPDERVDGRALIVIREQFRDGVLACQAAGGGDLALCKSLLACGSEASRVVHPNPPPIQSLYAL
jgi:hypothetical protein